MGWRPDSEVIPDRSSEQLSAGDRALIERLKQTYSPAVLFHLFSDNQGISPPTSTTSSTYCAFPSSRSRSTTATSVASTAWTHTSSERPYSRATNASSVLSRQSSVQHSSTNRSSIYSTPSSLRRSATVSSLHSRQTSLQNSCLEEEPLVLPDSSAEQFRPKSATEVLLESQAFPIPPPTQPLPILPHQAPKHTRHRPILDAPITYYCTWCGEIFNEYHEWQKHERFTHDLQYYWPCPYPACETVFIKAEKFEAHHEEAHGCSCCMHASEVILPLPGKKMWGCGFDLCREHFDDWENRCRHVAWHYETFARTTASRSRPRQWRYSNLIRNLLRQPTIDSHFKRFLIRHHGPNKATWPKLRWKVGDSAELRRRLEYGDFSNGIGDTIHLAYRLGHPATTASLAVMKPAPAIPQNSLARPIPLSHIVDQRTTTLPVPSNYSLSRSYDATRIQAVFFPTAPLPQIPSRRAASRSPPRRLPGLSNNDQPVSVPLMPPSLPPTKPLPSPPRSATICQHILTGDSCACNTAAVAPALRSPTTAVSSMSYSETGTLVDNLEILSDFPQPPEFSLPFNANHNQPSRNYPDTISRTLSVSPSTRPLSTSVPPGLPLATTFPHPPETMKRPKTPQAFLETAKSFVKKIPTSTSSKQTGLMAQRHDSKGEEMLGDDDEDVDYHDFARAQSTSKKKLLTLAEFLRENPGPEYSVR